MHIPNMCNHHHKVLTNNKYVLLIFGYINFLRKIIHFSFLAYSLFIFYFPVQIVTSSISYL